MTTLADILKAARDSLTEETWLKGSYFQEESGKLCMCAHGAVQAQVNPIVKQLVNDSELTTLSIAEKATQESRMGAMAANYAVRDFELSKMEMDYAWRGRPSHMSQDGKRGTLEAHYLLGLVGLTGSFNDEPGTHLQDVKDKFNEAISFAEGRGI